MENICKLHGIEAGKDIYIIGSGKSIDYIPASFWKGKVCLGVNFACESVPCKYGITHHLIALRSIVSTGAILIVAEHERCVGAEQDLTGICEGYSYKHTEQGYTKIDLSHFEDPECLTAGGSVVTEALHFAYQLGAANIILCGVDEGRINEKMNCGVYNGRETNIDHPANVQAQLMEIIGLIRSKGVPVISLNPFYSLRLEGNKFDRFVYDPAYSKDGGKFIENQ